MTPTESKNRSVDPESRRVDMEANRIEQLRRRKTELEYERACHKRWLIDRVLWDGPAVSRYNAMVRDEINAEIRAIDNELGPTPPMSMASAAKFTFWACLVVLLVGLLCSAG